MSSGTPSPSETDLQAAVTTLREAIVSARRGLVERETLVEAIVLAAVAGEHLLVIGPPGTAKSEAARRVARALGGRTFEYLLGRFTEPNEIFGPIDLRKLREGTVEVETTGMLPEAEIAFLDEVFLGSTAILNTLLGVLNERVFRRGHTVRAVPLRVAIGASNALPEDESLAAFADRFLLRAFVEPVGDPFLEQLLTEGWGVQGPPPEPVAGAMAALDTLSAMLRQVDLTDARPHLAHAVRVMRKAGIVLPDRRVVRTQRLIAAAALLDGRSTAGAADLWPVIYAVPTAQGQSLAREALGALLVRSENQTLMGAAAEASGGPLARAARIAEAGASILGARPVDGDPLALDGWKRRVEGIGREIDACFTASSRPASLAALRGQVSAALGEP
jgi:MoxR-like ATPase